MANAKIKTTENTASVADFINAITDEQKRKDSFAVIAMMKKQTGFEPRMWGPAIVGFGSYHYQYESGREGDMPLVSFSPRKNELAFYFSSVFKDREALLKQLGKHKTAKACVYVKKLDDINPAVLEKMITHSMNYYKDKHQ